MKRAAIICASLLLAATHTPGQSRAVTRRALLIANSAYEHLPRLQTPKPSANALADALAKARFERQVVYDTSQSGLIAAVRQFTDSVQPGDFVVVYYSGYGYQADDLNYILPVGFDPKDQSAPGLSAYSIRNLQRRLEMRKAGTAVLLLDASRPGPGLPEGLATMPPSSRTLVSFSAAPNQAARDVPDRSVDLFTGALIRAINEPGAKPAAVLERARAEVSRISGGQQVPHVIESPVPDFAFTPGTVASSEGSKERSKEGSKGSEGSGTTASGPMWPMDGGDARRSGFAPYRGPRKPHVAWSIDAGSRDPNSPLIGPDGRIYVWGAKTTMSLRSVENGRIVWTVPLSFGQQVSFAPDGMVQVTTFTGKTRTLDSDGKKAGEGSADARFLGLFLWQGHPYNSGGFKPEGSSVTQFYFFRVDQKDTWRAPIDSQAIWPVVDSSGVLYTGTEKGTLYAVNPDASTLWSYATGSSPVRGLAVTKNRDLLAAAGSTLYNVRERRPKWTFQGDGAGNVMPPIHDQTGMIYFGKGSDFYSVSPEGKLVWRLPLGETVTTAPAMDRSGRIYVASASKLYCISD